MKNLVNLCAFLAVVAALACSGSSASKDGGAGGGGGNGGAGGSGGAGGGGDTTMACGAATCGGGQTCCTGCMGEKFCVSGGGCPGPKCDPIDGGSDAPADAAAEGGTDATEDAPGGDLASDGDGLIACNDKGVTCPMGLVCDYDTPGRCAASTATGHCKMKPSGCGEEKPDPMCGCDGMTYESDCARRLAGVQLDHEGACM